MKFFQKTLTVTTREKIELVDLTDLAGDFCATQRVCHGLMTVSSCHTTAAIRINEQCEKLYRDLKVFLETMAPASARYHHDHSPLDGRKNAHSHLLNFLMGNSETIPINDGVLTLGPYQRIFFVELDGPRALREVCFSVLGKELSEI